MVERHLEVEVTGLDRKGQPIRVHARGWQARILQVCENWTFFILQIEVKKSITCVWLFVAA